MSHQESLESKVNETKATVKFQLKKVLCMGVAVGHCGMDEKQIFQNVQMSVNFLVSLLKKNWQNVCNSSLPCLYRVHCSHLWLLVIWSSTKLYLFAGEMLVPQEHNGQDAPVVLSHHLFRSLEIRGVWLLGSFFIFRDPIFVHQVRIMQCELFCLVLRCVYLFCGTHDT